MVLLTVNATGSDVTLQRCDHFGLENCAGDDEVNSSGAFASSYRFPEIGGAKVCPQCCHVDVPTGGGQNCGPEVGQETILPLFREKARSSQMNILMRLESD